MLSFALLMAMLLCYLSKIPVAYAMHQKGGYDNVYPRQQQRSLEGFGARALAAHQNSFEALVVFAVAALTAMINNQTAGDAANLALAFIIARFAYHLFYLLNWATLRSIAWFVGIGASFAIIWPYVF